MASEDPQDQLDEAIKMAERLAEELNPEKDPQAQLDEAINEAKRLAEKLNPEKDPQAQLDEAINEAKRLAEELNPEKDPQAQLTRPLTRQKDWLRSSTQNGKIRRKRQTSLQGLSSDGDKGMREDRLFLKPGRKLHPLLLLQGPVHQEPD